MSDGISRAAFKRCTLDPGVYSDFENSCFEQGMQMSNLMSSSTAAVQSKAVKTKHSFLQAHTIYKDGILYGRTTCPIRAPAVEVLALYMDNDSHFLNKYARGPSTLSPIP